MSGKNQFVSTLNWQNTDPATGFLPTHPPGGSVPSGAQFGVMLSTNKLYSNILDVSKMDSIGLEVTWGGTASGTITVLASNSGLNFYALTFNPALDQPLGTPGGYVIDLSLYPFKYLMVQYVNSSGVGALSCYLQLKDLN